VHPAESGVAPAPQPGPEKDADHPHGTNPVRVAALTIVVLAAGAALSLARQDGPGAWRTVWAEDGRVFLSDALVRGTLEPLLAPYNGYAHLVPRLLAAIAAAAPLGGAAAILAVGSALGVSATAIVVWWATGGWIGSPLARGVLAALVVLVPAGQTETLNNAANLHWFLLFGAFWVFCWEPDGRWGRIAGGLVVFAAAASDPLVVLLAGAAAFRWRHRRVLRSGVPYAAAIAGLAVQAVSPLVGTSDRAFASWASWWNLGPWYANRVVGRSVLGTRLLGDDGVAAWLATAAAVLLLGAALWHLIRRVTGPRRELTLLALGTSVLTYLVPVFSTGVAAARYEVLPVLLLVSAVVVAVDGCGVAVRHRHLVVAALLWAVVLVGIDFRVPTSRGDGPTWARGLAAAEERCATGASVAPAPITPREGAWTAALPCDRLGTGTRR